MRFDYGLFSNYTFGLFVRFVIRPCCGVDATGLVRRPESFFMDELVAADLPDKLEQADMDNRIAMNARRFMMAPLVRQT